MSFRVKGKKLSRRDYKSALPVFSVDTPMQAKQLIEKVSYLGWIGEGPAYRFVGSNGTYDDLAACTKECEAVWETREQWMMPD